MLAQSTCLRPALCASPPSTRHPLTNFGDLLVPIGAEHGLLAMPFDALRYQYAGAVMAGLVQRSIRVSGKLERALDAMEKLILGPLARQR
jgi:hypothetical protein